MRDKIKIIDCTIRDGGHLNGWDFDPICVKASYYAAIKSGADYFEIGYRMPESIAGKGLFAYSTDIYLKSLIDTPVDSCKILVMIDAGKADHTLFSDRTKENTIISGVRVAAYPYELEQAIDIVEKLHNLGYEVFLNLMASSELSVGHYAFLKSWNKKHIVNAVCFADSFGSFIPKEITAQINKIQDCGFKKIGFHGHNNLQMAFANTLQAISDGVYYVDASIFGMGRGSGNLPMEVFIGYLEKEGQVGYNTVPLLEVIERFYLDLFKKYDWGYKIQSLLGGLKNIHPYYVDEICKNNSYTLEEIWNALDVVKQKCPISYSADKLNKMLDGRFYTPLTAAKAKEIFNAISDQLTIIPAADAFIQDSFDLSNKYLDKKFLIIANGASIVSYRDKIEKFIQKEQCIVIGLNYIQNLYNPNYHLFVSRKRFEKYIHTVYKKSELIVPSFFGKNFVRNYYEGVIHYIDMVHAESKNELPLDKSTQKIMYLNVAIAAILLACQMGAKEIFAVGIDGYMDNQLKDIKYFYDEDDVPEDKDISSLRYEKFAEELDRINRFLLSKSVPFSIITPTSHKKYYRKFAEE